MGENGGVAAAWLVDRQPALRFERTRAASSLRPMDRDRQPGEQAPRAPGFNQRLTRPETYWHGALSYCGVIVADQAPLQFETPVLSS